MSWDEALDFFASKLKTLRDTHGPESVAFFPHGLAPQFFATLMKAYGTPNSAEPSFAQCRGPREVGYGLTFGHGLGSPEPVDLEESKLIVLIGSHLGENVFTSQITAFATGLSRGAKLIAVDPRFSTAAAKADWWLPIRPGTDIALLLAWMNVLIAEGLYDREYIAEVRGRILRACGARPGVHARVGRDDHRTARRPHPGNGPGHGRREAGRASSTPAGT